MSKEMLNEHGDVLIPTTGLHGGNISSQRLDDLDAQCIECVKTFATGGVTPQVLDIGGGNGAHARRMAKAGAMVTLIDLSDQSAAVDAFNAEIGRRAIDFRRADIRTIDLDAISAPHVIYSQRMMGCIRYGELASLMKELYIRGDKGLHCFVSASGLETEYGVDYPHRDRPVAERFAAISPAMAEKHQMYAPECLYRVDELADLVSSAGFHVLEAWRSRFGTPKIIGEKISVRPASSE